MAKVIVGMSGGVDSSVAALLLKQQGHEVTGLFMKNWEDDGECPAAVDFEDVADVCRLIGIPYYTVNFVKEYREEVFSDFLKESLAGRTPNPDVLCNREIKFKAFYAKAKELGADYLATGHYCRVGRRGGRAALLRGSDPNKDQSYFLYAVQGKVLEEVLFPIGDLPKQEVRRIAKDAGLSTAAKKDSTGICFIGKRDFKEFLGQHLKGEPGDFVDSSGRIVGRHDGLPFYTIGQRRGLAIGGPGEAWFVAGKDLQKNQVLLVQGEEHPALYRKELLAGSLTFIDNEGPKLPFRCTAKIRYRQEDKPCTVTAHGEGLLRVEFDQPQRAVTPGQSVVFYDGELCLGGGIIQ